MPKPKEYSYDVFISHASSDRPRVQRLAARLKAEGLRVWLDKWVLKPGEKVKPGISRGADRSRTVVMCISPAALKSEWVKFEKNLALQNDPDNLDRRFIPLLLTTCTIPKGIKKFVYVDYRRESKEAFKELLSACKPEDTTSFVKYTYPDPEDRVTYATIKALQPYDGYWSMSESEMLREFLARALTDSPRGRHASGIDIGCGYGRLISWLLDNCCRQVTALEPDPARLAAAKTSPDRDKLSRVSFAEQTIQDFTPQAKFDLVLCSHLMQHVQRAELHLILSKIRSICTDDARVILLTTHSTAGADRFVKAYMKSESAFSEDPISADEFDSLVANRQGVLPIRFFDFDTLTRSLQNAGLKLIDHYVYHCCEGNFGELDKHCFRDRIVNAVPELRARFGRDIAVVAAPA